MTLRSAVTATCTTLLITSLTVMTLAAGSMMRRQITASILIGTLSRVIASCGSTAVVRMRMSVITRHSRNGRVKYMPGPAVRT